MRSLGALRARLRGLLVAALLRRLAAWLACALILLSAGTAIAALLRLGAGAQLGLALAAISALPAFLLWPASELLLELGLRRMDEGSVFEAYLEAPPGPARELLGPMAAERAAALAVRPAERARMPHRLALLLAASAICLAVVEAGSLIVLKRPLLIYAGPPDDRGNERAEEGSFTGPGSEASFGESPEGESDDDDEARDAEEVGGSAIGEGSGGAEGLALRRRMPQPEEEVELPDSGDGAAARHAGGAGGASGEEAADGAAASSGVPGSGPADRGERAAGRMGRGFESSGDTRIPSPLLDYRARFSRVYAERTGKHFAASGALDLGELGRLQRMFFRSFAISADIAPGEDPYDALLKRRWRDLRRDLDGALREGRLE